LRSGRKHRIATTFRRAPGAKPGTKRGFPARDAVSFFRPILTTPGRIGGAATAGVCDPLGCLRLRERDAPPPTAAVVALDPPPELRPRFAFGGRATLSMRSARPDRDFIQRCTATDSMLTATRSS